LVQDVPETEGGRAAASMLRCVVDGTATATAMARVMYKNDEARMMSDWRGERRTMRGILFVGMVLILVLDFEIMSL